MRFIKLHEGAKIPYRGSIGSAGYDISALGDESIPAGKQLLVKTGIAWENIPRNIVGLIRPRSGIALKNRVDVRAGVIDSDYTGEIGVLLVNEGETTFYINAGDRIGQLVMTSFLCMNDDEVEGERDGGFGSTGM